MFGHITVCLASPQCIALFASSTTRPKMQLIADYSHFAHGLLTAAGVGSHGLAEGTGEEYVQEMRGSGVQGG